VSTRHTASPGEWALADAFDRAAPTYDGMVALSPGYHNQLRSAAEALVAGLPEGGGPVLDLGCGSGASTSALYAAWLRAHPGAPLDVIGVDASGGMLDQARRKVWPAGVSFVESDAVTQLRTLPDGSVSGVLAAYLLRNVPDREAVVTEIARVLAPGAPAVIHDYSVAGSRRARAVWAAVCHAIIIPLAVVKRSDVPLHRYLFSSVRDFDSVDRICARLLDAGFVDVRHRSYPGWQEGLVHTVVGRTSAGPKP
jgi:ubiquinone/menaquinone biosynthesis C-methylase UbiE